MSSAGRTVPDLQWEWIVTLSRRLRSAWRAYAQVGKGRLHDPDDPDGTAWRLVLRQHEWRLVRAMDRLGLEDLTCDGWLHRRQGGAIGLVRVAGRAQSVEPPHTEVIA